MRLKHFITGTCAAVMLILGLGVVLDSNPSDAAGYVNLAEFSFVKAEADSSGDLWDTYGIIDKAKKGIPATGGEFKDDSRLYSAVSFVNDDANYRKLKWANADEKIKYDGVVLEAVPVLEPKEIDTTTDGDKGEPWAGTPFFKFKTKTTGYDGIRLTLKLGGSKKGPRDFKLQYSTDDETYRDIANSDTVITDNKILFDFSFDTLPEALDNQAEIYLRLIVTSEYNIGGDLFTGTDEETGESLALSGKLAINDVIISGKKIGSVVATDAPATSSPEPTAVPAGCFAAFNFSRPFAAEGTVADADLNTTYKVNGAVDGYKAIDGALASSSIMYASLDGTNYAPLSWNGESNTYTYEGLNALAVPVLDASETTPWGKSPFFLFKLSTTNYDNIKLSFKLGGTKKGPKNYKLQYSTDNKSYTDILGAVVSIPYNKELFAYSVSLPAAVANKDTVYIRLIASDETSIGGEKTGNFTGLTGGEAAINDVIFEKVSDNEYNATPAPARTSAPTKSPAPTKVPATKSPEPTKVPATNTPEPTKAPEIEPTEVPSTEAPSTEVPSSEPTKVPLLPTTAPQPTALAVQSTAIPTLSPSSPVPAATAAPDSDEASSAKKKLATPKLTSYKRGAKVVKGTSVKKAKVTLKVGNKKYTISANAKGKFAIKLKSKLKKGIKLTVFAVKSGFSKSSTRVYKVK